MALEFEPSLVNDPHSIVCGAALVKSPSCLREGVLPGVGGRSAYLLLLGTKVLEGNRPHCGLYFPC